MGDVRGAVSQALGSLVARSGRRASGSRTLGGELWTLCWSSVNPGGALYASLLNLREPGWPTQEITLKI